MHEWVVVSGKGGVGKTSVLASLAVSFQQRAVVVDCDVDAADLHLVLTPRIERQCDFVGGRIAQLNAASCTNCGQCVDACRFDAIRAGAKRTGSSPQSLPVELPQFELPQFELPQFDALSCEGCGVCVHVCPSEAVQLVPSVNGRWFVSQTRCGPMVHARMNPGGENSGRLVTVLRREAARLAEHHGLDMILCDGSPGIGCAVIASLTGADQAVIVSEPTLSSLHDFRRVAELAGQLQIPCQLVINKADLNPQVGAELEREATRLGIPLAGRIPYDPEVSRAQIERRALVEVSDGPAAQAMRRLGRRLSRQLANCP